MKQEEKHPQMTKKKKPTTKHQKLNLRAAIHQIFNYSILGNGQVITTLFALYLLFYELRNHITSGGGEGAAWKKGQRLENMQKQVLSRALLSRVQPLWLSPPQLGAQPEGSNGLPGVCHPPQHTGTFWKTQEVAQHPSQERRLLLMEGDLPLSLLHSQADLAMS